MIRASIADLLSAEGALRSAGWVLLQHLLSRGSPALVGIILTHRLAPDAFAAYSYYLLTVSMLSTYASIGLGSASARFGADPAGPRLLGTLWILSAGFAASAALLVLLIPPAWLSAGLEVPPWILAAGVFGMALQWVSRGAMVGLERHRSAALSALVSSFVFLVGAVIAVRSSDVRYAMFGSVAGAFIQWLIETSVVARTSGWDRMFAHPYFGRAAVRQVLAFSAPMFVVSLLSASGAWIVGRIILSTPGGDREFALFSIGLQWFALAMVIPGIIAAVSLPKIVRSLTGRAGSERTRQIVRSSSLCALGIAAAIATGGLVLETALLGLYGEEYRVEGRFIALYLLAGIVAAPTNSVGNAIVATDRQWHWLGLTVLWASVLASTAFALRDRSVWGGAVTYMAAYAVLMAASTVLARRRGLL
jgi:O-antigen/teichoic acid export membrane protein